MPTLLAVAPPPLAKFSVAFARPQIQSPLTVVTVISKYHLPLATAFDVLVLTQLCPGVALSVAIRLADWTPPPKSDDQSAENGFVKFWAPETVIPDRSPPF